MGELRVAQPIALEKDITFKSSDSEYSLLRLKEINQLFFKFSYSNMIGYFNGIQTAVFHKKHTS